MGSLGLKKCSSLENSYIRRPAKKSIYRRPGVKGEDQGTLHKTHTHQSTLGESNKRAWQSFQDTREGWSTRLKKETKARGHVLGRNLVYPSRTDYGRGPNRKGAGEGHRKKRKGGELVRLGTHLLDICWGNVNDSKSYHRKKHPGVMRGVPSLSVLRMIFLLGRVRDVGNLQLNCKGIRSVPISHLRLGACKTRSAWRKHK